MLNRRGRQGTREVIGSLSGKFEVGGEQRGGSNLAAKIAPIQRVHDEEPDEGGHKEHHSGNGQQPSDSAGVELPQRNASGMKAFVDQ